MRPSARWAPWIGGGLLTIAVALAVSASLTPPALVPLDPVKVEVADLRFVTEVTDENGYIQKSPDPSKYRLAILTLKLNKPAGKRLMLAAADLSLHYWRGDNYDVAPCEGISKFTLRQDEPRGLGIGPEVGPGKLKEETTTSTTRATTVYVDALFALIEKDATEAWVCLGQAATEPLTTGW